MSPRRRMRVAFTCNVCGQRTTRAINPHAYTDGTVFVQKEGGREVLLKGSRTIGNVASEVFGARRRWAPWTNRISHG